MLKVILLIWVKQVNLTILMKLLRKHNSIYMYLDYLSLRISNSMIENNQGDEAMAYIFAGALYNISMY